jgi:hypothetical protein
MRLILVFVMFFIYPLSGSGMIFPPSGSPDTLENQVLYNGRLWRNSYSRIRGDPFLFSDQFLTGSVTIGSKTFNKVNIKYDIYNDELITLSDNGFIIQINKEVVEAFSFRWQERDFRFRKMDSDSLKNTDAFVNVLAEGDVSLLVRYRKEVLFLAVDNKYDQFNQTHRIYIKKDGITHLVNSKKELLRLLDDRKQQIRSMINSSNLKISRGNPDSFMTVVKYYNELQKK